MHDEFRFDDDSFAALGIAGVSWQSAQYVVLYANPQLRRFSLGGQVLTIIGQDQDGAWLAVASIEEQDDAYLVVGARRLAPDELRDVRKWMEGDR